MNQFYTQIRVPCSVANIIHPATTAPSNTVLHYT